MKATEILSEVQQRPYPLPRGPWIMHQTWHEVLFAHWPLQSKILRPLIPDALEIDTFEGDAWVGVVPFRMSGVRPRTVPALPTLSAFPELNVRTYVTINKVPGVYFFSLDAGNPIAVAIARIAFHLPYFYARMESRRQKETIAYTSTRIHRGAPSAEYRTHYRPIAPIVYAQSGSLEAWLTERYALYTTAGSHLYRGDIHHVRWPLQKAEQETERDTMALSHGIHLPTTDPLLYYASRQDVLVWPLHRLLS